MNAVKKTIKTFISAVLLLIFIIAIAVPGAVSVRGDFDDYLVPEEFSESLEKADTVRGEQDYARIMTANLLVHYESWGGTDAHKRAKMFFQVLDTYAPDVVAVQEMSDQWYCCIMKNKGSYRMLYPLTSGALLRMTALLYNSDTVTLLEQGQTVYSQRDNARLRRIAWGLFEDKKSKQQYVVTSTHLDLIREGQEISELKVMNTQAQEEVKQAQTLCERFHCPVFSAGDFNAMDHGGYDEVYDAPSVYEYLSDTLTDTKKKAKKKTAGNAKKVSAPTYDHIFLCGEAVIHRYTILSDHAMDAMSDHYPIFIDVSTKA